jgi:hypothetical protein
MQMIETMAWGTEAIARLYGVPLHLLQYPNGSSSYASLEVISAEWLRLGLGPLIARVEAGLQRLIVGNTTFVKFNVDALLRPMTKERYDAYAVALNNGWLSLNEIRQLEDRAPIGPAGDEFRQPLNIGIVGQEPAPDTQSTREESAAIEHAEMVSRAVTSAIQSLPQTVVSVEAPKSKRKKINRDDGGNIIEIVEE